MSSTTDSVSGEAIGSAVRAFGEQAEAATQAAGMVAEQVSQVGREVYSQADKMIDDAKTQLRERADEQLVQAADALDRLHRQTRALAQGRLDEAGPLVDYANEGAERLGDLAQRIRSSGVNGVVADVARFARRRPVVFLAGSALAGLAIGRLIRNEAVVAQARQRQGQLPASGSAQLDAQVDQDAAPDTDPMSVVPTEDAEQ